MFGNRRTTVVADAPEKPVQVVEPVVVSAPVSNPPAVLVPSVRSIVSQRIQDLLGFCFTLVALLILARFALFAAGANMEGGFATWVRQISDPLVSPFLTLFDNPIVPHFRVFEIGDILALFVYAIATSLACYLVSLILTPTFRVARRP